jgi:hypothetical protein
MIQLYLAIDELIIDFFIWLIFRGKETLNFTFVIGGYESTNISDEIIVPSETSLKEGS